VKKLIRKIFHSGEFDYSFDLIQNHKKFTFASDVAKAVLLFFVVCSQPAITNAVDIQCVGPSGKTYSSYLLALLKC